MDSPHLKQLDELIDEYCTPEWRDLATQNTSHLKFKAGENIFKEGQKADYIYMVNHGRVKVYSNYTDDVEVILRFATDGQVIGHRGMGEDFTFSVTAVAMAPTSVKALPMSVFQSLLKANNEFCYFFLLFFTEELRRSERSRKNLLNMTVKQRVAKAVRMTGEAFGFDSDNPTLLAYTITRKDIASLANTTYESVIRSLGELQNDGLIKLEGKQIHILDRNALCDLTLCNAHMNVG